MMISQQMNQKLNEQITHELFAEHSYLAMSCALMSLGLPTLARWFLRQASEEREHAMKILKYLQEVGGTVALDAIARPDVPRTSPEKIVQAALDHERKVTSLINELVALADSEKDYASRSFLQWYVDEQVEEVSSVTGLLQLIKLAGPDQMIHVEARVAKMMAS